MKKFKVTAVIAAAVMVLSTATVLSGCGSDESSSSESSSSAVTTTAPATTKATTPNNAGGTETTSAQSDYQQGTEQGQASNNDGNTDATVEDYGNEKHGNITSEEAAQIAIQNCEYGQYATLADPAEYNGQDCWHVVVVDTAGKYINCYVSSVMFEAIPQEDQDNPYNDYDDDYDDDDDYYDFNGADGAEP